MHPQFPVPKVMYLQQRQPELARRAVHYDTANDYVYRILGCPCTMDYSIASRFGGFDVRRHQWSKTIFEAADFSPELFSKAVCAGTVIGEMPRSLAASLGLTEPVLLVAGGHDQPCAALAIGGGGSAGFEGPVSQIGSGIASTICRFSKTYRRNNDF